VSQLFGDAMRGRSFKMRAAGCARELLRRRFADVRRSFNPAVFSSLVVTPSFMGEA
jgi:hypothetical protein